MISFVVLIVELILLAITDLNGISVLPDYLMSIIIGLYSIVFVLEIYSGRRDMSIKQALIVGFLLRIALLYFDIYGKDIYALPNSGADSEVYYYASLRFAYGITRDTNSFSKIIGYVFRYCGVSRLLGQFLVLECSILSLLCADKAMETVDIEQSIRSRTMWILCLLPNYAIISVIFLREAPISMLVSLSFLFFVRWYKSGSILDFVFAITTALIGAIFHSGILSMAIGLISCRLLFDIKRRELHFSIVSVFSAVLFAFAFSYLLTKYGDLLTSKFGSIDSIDDIAATSTVGGSSYARYVGNSNSTSNMVLYTIPRIIFFLFSPMPWMWRGINDVIAFLFSSLFYFNALRTSIEFLRSGERKNRELVILLLIVLICMSFVFGWGVSNSGTACRHREKMTIIWGILYGLTLRKTTQKNPSLYIS